MCRRAGPSNPDYRAGRGIHQGRARAYRDATLPDLLGPQTRLLFVGINPGLWTAAAQAHFSRRGNRFYPALLAAGIIDRPIDASAGYDPKDREYLLERGLGITNLVARATARADELTADELLRRRAPAAGAGAQTWRSGRRGAGDHRVPDGVRAHRGPSPDAQPETLGGAQLWVVPNPSGLNAHSSLAALATAYREVAVAAGLEVSAT